MPKHSEQQILEHYKSDAALNSLDIQPAPKLSIKALPTQERQRTDSPVVEVRQPVVAKEEERRVSEVPMQTGDDRKPAVKNKYADVADADLPRPNRDKTSPGAKIASTMEIPVTAVSGYLSAKHGGLRVASVGSEKLFTLSDHAVPEKLAVDFGQSRVQMTRELQTRYDASLDKVNGILKSEPHLFEQGCKFEFCNTGISEEMTKKLYRGNNLGEVVGALDNIPVKDLTIDQVKQVGEYAERIGGSPLLKEEGLSHLAAQMQGSAGKLAETMANPISAEATKEAESEMYGYITRLRQEMGLRQYDAQEFVKTVAKERPDLLEMGHRFEFDPTIPAEKVAELKRPGLYGDLLDKVKKTYAPEAKSLITSQGEDLKALSGLSENALIKSEGLTGMASRLEANAAKVVESRVKTYDLLSKEQGTFLKKNLGLLGIGIATNWAVDKVFFNESKPGIMSYAADIAAPIILLTEHSPQVKLGVMIGSHLLARLSEK